MSTFKLFLSIVIMILLTSCQPQNGTNPVEFRVPVTVAEVGVEDVEELVTTTGNVRAPEVIKLSVMTGGLLQIAVGKAGRLAEGDSVKAGELIASITGEDVRLASKMRVVAQKLREAKKNLEATTTLFKNGVVSGSVLEREKTAYENAKLEYETSLHSENRNKIISPIDGIILKLGRDKGQLMANGQLVVPGQVIAEIAALETVIADVDLVGKDIARVAPGLGARARYYAWQETEFPGRVLRLSPTLNETTRSLRAEVEIDNSELLLKPGMFVEVALVADKRAQVPVIPRRSLTRRGGRRVVFVVNGQRAEQRKVELGLGNGQHVEIRKGVAVGEKVVVLGLETLTDQMPVRVTGS